MAKDLDKTIRRNAKVPKRAAGHSGSMEQHDQKDQIETDRYLNSKQAARSSGLGICMTELVPPGAS